MLLETPACIGQVDTIPQPTVVHRYPGLAWTGMYVYHTPQKLVSNGGDAIVQGYLCTEIGV